MLKKNNFTLTVNAYAQVKEDVNLKTIFKDIKGKRLGNFLLEDDVNNGVVDGIDLLGNKLFSYFDEVKLFSNLTDETKFDNPEDCSVLLHSKKGDILHFSSEFSVTNIIEDISHRTRMKVSNPKISNVTIENDNYIANMMNKLTEDSCTNRNKLNGIPFDFEYEVKEVSKESLFTNVYTDAVGLYYALDFIKDDENLASLVLLQNSVLCDYHSIIKNAESLEEVGFISKYISYFGWNEGVSQKEIYEHTKNLLRKNRDS